MNISIEKYIKKGDNSHNYLKLFRELSSIRIFTCCKDILTEQNLRSIDRGREMTSDDQHTPGTGDGSLLEGHAGSV